MHIMVEWFYNHFLTETLQVVMGGEIIHLLRDDLSYRSVSRKTWLTLIISIETVTKE